MMKEKGMTTLMDYTDLTMDEQDDPLPQKFKFPNMRKYSGTDDPHLHLKQYVTYMKPTGLSKAQISNSFYYPWKELLSSSTTLWMHVFSETGRSCVPFLLSSMG